MAKDVTLAGIAAKVGVSNVAVIIPEHFYGDSVSFYGRLYEKVVRALYDNQYYGIFGGWV